MQNQRNKKEKNIELTTYGWAVDSHYEHGKDKELDDKYASEDLVFCVPQKWLEKQIDEDLEEWLSEYIHDDSLILYNSAKRQGVLVS